MKKPRIYLLHHWHTENNDENVVGMFSSAKNAKKWLTHCGVPGVWVKQHDDGEDERLLWSLEDKPGRSWVIFEHDLDRPDVAHLACQPYLDPAREKDAT